MQGNKTGLTFSVEVISHGETFKTKIAGVTKHNEDGVDRQKLIKRLVPGEELILLRERDNPYDKWAIAVLNARRQKLGYLPRGDSRTASHMDGGGKITAKVVAVRGGSGILGIFFSSLRKSYGCVIEVTKQDFDWKQVTPFLERSKEIEERIKAARKMEESEPTEAILSYRAAIADIIAFDSVGPAAAAWRRARYPIGRLSLLLEKAGLYEAALEEISRYDAFNDVLGLAAADQRSVAARKSRLLKKLGRS